jgi:hypothetical protein
MWSPPAWRTLRADTSTWFPFTIPWDATPVDLSWLNERPAGGHGFLTVKDGKLVFEGGTRARFWGTCVSAAANFPTHEQSEAIARRPAQFGLNLVRTRTESREGGEGPIPVEPITGQVVIHTAAKDFEVFAIAPDGTRSALGRLEGGVEGIALKLGPSARTIYYELVAG